jgi:N,N'-diacetyllegionaminate synthase
MYINPIPFGSRFIGPGHPAVIIAEIGINHEGSVSLCASMIEAAANSGVDAVKLQSADPEQHYLPETKSYDIYSKALLKPDETLAMFALAKELGLEVLTTCGDDSTFALIESLNPAAHKISSGMLGHLPMIRRFASSGRPLIFSSGMANIENLDMAINTARQHGGEHIAMMQCVSLYPAEPEIMNLRVMHTLSSRYSIPTGLSDHSLGIEVSNLAVAAGAHVIEKHFSFDRNRPNFDHKISLEPAEMKALVARIRRTEVILGSGLKSMTELEESICKEYSRKLVAKIALPSGKVLEDGDLAIMRTSELVKGIVSTDYDKVIGRKLVRSLCKFELVLPDDLT